VLGVCLGVQCACCCFHICNEPCYWPPQLLVQLWMLLTVAQQHALTILSYRLLRRPPPEFVSDPLSSTCPPPIPHPPIIPQAPGMR
jgi:hypothetical protein